MLTGGKTEDAKASLLSWERGLKFTGSGTGAFDVNVAPLVGAWIEIILERFSGACVVRRSSRGSVD